MSATELMKYAALFVLNKVSYVKNIFFIFSLLSPFFAEALQVSDFSVVEKLKPGEKRQVSLTLFNDRDTEEQVNLSLVDYGCNSEGQHFFGDLPEKAMRSNISWVHLGQDRVKLAPQERRAIYYVIEVPKDSSLKGSYWSVLLIEPTEILNAENLEKGQFKVNVKIRYAHHIVTNIGEGTTALKLFKKEIKEIEGKRYLCIHVLNEGDQFFVPSLTLKLYDRKGVLKKTLETQTERLYPGNPQSFLVDIGDLTEDELRNELSGFVLFDAKGDHVFGDRFTYP